MFEWTKKLNRISKQELESVLSGSGIEFDSDTTKLGLKALIDASKNASDIVLYLTTTDCNFLYMDIPIRMYDFAKHGSTDWRIVSEFVGKDTHGSISTKLVYLLGNINYKIAEDENSLCYQDIVTGQIIQLTLNKDVYDWILLPSDTLAADIKANYLKEKLDKKETTMKDKVNSTTNKGASKVELESTNLESTEKETIMNDKTEVTEANEAISNQPVTKDETVDKSEGEMKSSTSATIRDKATEIFQSDSDNRFKTLDIAYSLFADFQESPVTNKVSVELSKANVESYLKLAGVNKIEVNHSTSLPKLDSDNNVITDKNNKVVTEWKKVKSRVKNKKFNTLVIDVFAFTRLIAIVDKKSERDKTHRNSTRLLNQLCRHEITEKIEGVDTLRYEFVLEMKPVKDFVKICFSDKSNADFFANCVDKSKQEIGQVIASIVSVISNPSVNAIEVYGMKPVEKDKPAEMFQKAIDFLQNDDLTKEQILRKLKTLYPKGLADLELPKSDSDTTEPVVSIAAG
tara:strand:- start:332 stop:1879 length:1548 start_codon:yes stop_codon:yes gene_type:complete